MKKFLSILAVLLLFIFSAELVRAGGFYLTSIGSLDVEGTAYPQYWYTGSSPVISGVAPASTVVTVEVDGTSATTTSDASGNWSYTTSIGEGDHTIKLSATGVNAYTFTLTIGTPPDDVGAISAPDTPVAGTSMPTIMLLSLGVVLLLTPLALRKAI